LNRLSIRKKPIQLMLFALMLLLTGCGVFGNKSKVRTREQKQITEKGVRIVEIPKDSIVYVPHYVFKDTTVIVQNKNLVLKTTYKDRKVQKITAIQKPKKEINPYERTEQIRQKVTDLKSESPGIKPVYWLYIFGGLAFLIVVNNLTKSVKS